jgi:hypothetical protein
MKKLILLLAVVSLYSCEKACNCQVVDYERVNGNTWNEMDISVSTDCTPTDTVFYHINIKSNGDTFEDWTTIECE